jgi:hypothetical protein
MVSQAKECIRVAGISAAVDQPWISRKASARDQQLSRDGERPGRFCRINAAQFRPLRGMRSACTSGFGTTPEARPLRQLDSVPTYYERKQTSLPGTYALHSFVKRMGR